jgi:hypothetical protein
MATNGRICHHSMHRWSPWELTDEVIKEIKARGRAELARRRSKSGGG